MFDVFLYHVNYVMCCRAAEDAIVYVTFVSGQPTKLVPFRMQYLMVNCLLNGCSTF